MESFDKMLDEVYDNLEQKDNISKFILPNPVLLKNGNNMHWKNIKDFLRLAKRPPDHFIKYLSDQISSKINWISESKSNGVIIYQKVRPQILLDVMKNYLKEFVICKSCKSYETYIEKDQVIRKYNFICRNCDNQYFI